MSLLRLPRRALLGTALALPLSALAQGRPRTVGDRLQLPPLLAMPGLQRERQLRIYLPPSYASAPTRRYPVVYFHDGQNVFDDATSYAGEWGADEALDALAAQGFEAIGVAIDNGGAKRMNEFNPWDHPRFGLGEGAAYMDFLDDVVQPFVDREFRTRSGREHTALVGSSMGALITLYALYSYPGTFGRGAVLSPSLWIAPQAFALPAKPLLPDTRVYLYAGGKEERDMVANAERLHRLMEGQGALKLQVDPEGQHREAAWRAVLPDALRHLFALQS